MTIDYQKERWDNFRRRIGHMHDGVYRHPNIPCAYVPAHPFADEFHRLKTLRMRPEDCRLVEVWWGIDGDAAILTCRADPKLSTTEYRVLPPERDGRALYLDALIKAPSVLQRHAEDAIAFFVRAGFPHGPHFLLREDDPPIVFKP